jgi:predicted transposase/invertase (TIGR01784 family)
MSEETIQNPHDHLFKETFSHVENAVGFFQNYLPDELRDRLDWGTLALQPGKYTDEALRGSESDLLYTVQIDQSPALLYCLFEHQSTPDAWMPLRLLRYILDIWEQYRKQNPEAKMLPPVLPLVLFQGGATWKADLSLSGLIDIPDGLAAYQPEFRHLLVDLNHINSDELKGSLILRASLLALKASSKGMHYELPRLFQLLAELTHQDSSLSMIRTLLRYICVVDNDTDLTEYIKQVEATQQPKLQEEAMTIAEQLITKGRQEGRQEGVQQAEAKTLLKILNKRFGSVPKSILETISTASSSQLEAWIDDSLDAECVEQVFNG